MITHVGWCYFFRFSCNLCVVSESLSVRSVNLCLYLFVLALFIGWVFFFFFCFAKSTLGNDLPSLLPFLGDPRLRLQFFDFKNDSTGIRLHFQCG